jgi:hypothetical protein
MNTFLARRGFFDGLPRALGLDVQRGEAFFAQVATRQALPAAIGLSAAVVVLGSAAYGFTFGLWRSPLLACYVAIKLPLLLVTTTSLVMLLNWIVAQLMASGLGFWQVAALTYRAMATASLVLASIAPVAAFLAIGCPPPRPHHDLSHNVLLLIHIAFVACAGVYGNSAVLRGLTRLCRRGTPIARLYSFWLASNVLVGCQLAWILRPFLGSPNYPVAFLRSDALEGNFFEFVFMTIVWRHFLGG